MIKIKKTIDIVLISIAIAAVVILADRIISFKNLDASPGMTEEYAETASDNGKIKEEEEVEYNFEMVINKDLFSPGKDIFATVPAKDIENVLEDMDMILIMSVNPGFSGQKFIPTVLPKIEQLKGMIEEKGLDLDVEVDGGIDPDTAPKVVKAGVNILAAGSAVFKGKGTIEENIRDLREAVRDYE